MIGCTWTQMRLIYKQLRDNYRLLLDPFAKLEGDRKNLRLAAQDFLFVSIG